MIQVVERQDLGSILGGALGQGLAQGAQERRKLQDQLMLRQQEQEDLKQTQQGRIAALMKLGYDQNKASAIASLEPTLAKEFIQDDLFNRMFGETPKQSQQQIIEENIIDETLQPKSQLERMSEEQLRKYASHPKFGKTFQLELDRRKEEREREFSKESKSDDRSFKRNEKYFEYLDKEVKDLPKKKLALTQMREALDSGNFGNLRNAAADYLNLPFLQTAEAATVSSAIKEFLIADLASISGRPNQFIEKQMSMALINPQYADEANEAILLGLEGLYKLKQREAEIAEQLEDKYISQGKEVPRNFQRLIQKELSKEVEKFEKEYQNQIKQLFKGMPQSRGEVEEKIGIVEDGKIYVRTVNGDIATIPIENYEEAVEAGVIIR